MSPGPEGIAALVRREWQAVLQLPAVADDDNFFESGGDSLAAIELATRLEDGLGVDFPFEVLFVDGSLRSVVDACVDAVSAGETSA